MTISSEICANGLITTGASGWSKGSSLASSQVVSRGFFDFWAGGCVWFGIFMFVRLFVPQSTAVLDLRSIMSSAPSKSSSAGSTPVLTLWDDMLIAIWQHSIRWDDGWVVQTLWDGVSTMNKQERRSNAAISTGSLKTRDREWMNQRIHHLGFVVKKQTPNTKWVWDSKWFYLHHTLYGHIYVQLYSKY